MKITAQDLLKFGIIDQIIAEPIGGAHRDPTAVITATGDAIAVALDSLNGLSPDDLRRTRAEKFLNMGRKL
jgi:acetyl-CoA carboxylase carboxyl transferase subunit alpha